jgi:hypothetical protein
LKIVSSEWPQTVTADGSPITRHPGVLFEGQESPGSSFLAGFAPQCAMSLGFD